MDRRFWPERNNRMNLGTSADSRFIPFIQFHEYEAYLFSDISRLEFFGVSAKTVAKLTQVIDAVGTTELIDDGPHTAPPKRMIPAAPDYEGAKPVIGQQAAQLIGLTRVRACCPHFNEGCASWRLKPRNEHSGRASICPSFSRVLQAKSVRWSSVKGRV